MGALVPCTTTLTTKRDLADLVEDVRALHDHVGDALAGQDHVGVGDARAVHNHALDDNVLDLWLTLVELKKPS